MAATQTLKETQRSDAQVVQLPALQHHFRCAPHASAVQEGAHAGKGAVADRVEDEQPIRDGKKDESVVNGGGDDPQ